MSLPSNITRSSDSFRTVPPIINGGDWECIVRDLETIIVLVLLAFNFIPQRSHHSLTLPRSRIKKRKHRQWVSATMHKGSSLTRDAWPLDLKAKVVRLGDGRQVSGRSTAAAATAADQQQSQTQAKHNRFKSELPLMGELGVQKNVPVSDTKLTLFLRVARFH